MSDSPAPAVIPVTSTIGSSLDYLLPGINLKDVPLWPPDVFAVAAWLLQKARAYPQVVIDWPPIDCSQADWSKSIRKLAWRWRKAVAADQQPPDEIAVWWEALVSQ